MSQSSSATAASGPRARTRRAILDAAIATLTKDASASLGEIARVAGVGRTTMHRYFPERSDLLAALTTDADEQVNAAYDRARLDEGPALDALNRLCQELFELGDSLQLLFNNPQLLTGTSWENLDEPDHALQNVLRRATAEGTLDPALDPEWAEQVLWSLLYAAWMYNSATGTPKHTVLTQCLHTLNKAFSVQASPNGTDDTGST